jgi:RNA polymerase sigma factor (sigma-70 family)
MGEHNPGNPELLPDLLAHCRAGDRPAADRLVRRFHAYATALARSLTNSPDHAGDAVQSAFVTVLTRLKDLRDPDAFPGWLRQIVRTECNRITRRNDPSPLSGDHVAATAEPADAIAHRELRDRVRAAVASLPAVQREAAELFYLDELPQADISRALDIPEGTVKRRLFDARATLRAALADTDKPKHRLPI